VDDALVLPVHLIFAVLTSTLVTGNHRKARLVFVMLDLVTRHSDHFAAVAKNWLVGALLTMLIDVANVQVLLVTVVWAGSESFWTIPLHVLLQLVKRDVSALAAVDAPEGCIGENL